MKEDNIKVVKATGSPASSGPCTPVHDGQTRAGREQTAAGREQTIAGQADLVKDGIAALPMENEFMYVEVEKMTSILPTMWMGSQRGK